MSDTLPPMNPLTALGGDVPRVDTQKDVTLSEVSDLALASFAVRLKHENAARKALDTFLGGALPGPGALMKQVLTCFWMGPDQWMVVAPHSSHEDLAAQLVLAADGAASVTEQNDAWCCFELKGPHLASVFELLCPVNLRGALGGEATRTTIDHLGCFLLVMEPNHMRILGPRSSAGSLHHALLTAMRAAL